MVDPSLGRYDDIRRDVKALQAETAGQPIAEEARAFMAEVDATYATLADEAYWAATENAYALVSMSKFDQAAAAVKTLVDGERARLLKLDLSDRLDSLERHIREAKLVQSLIVDGLLNARGIVRLKLADRPLSGKVLKIEDDVLTLKPSVGEAQDVSLGELEPVELVNASGLARLGSVKPESIAAFYLVRGEVEAAKATIADLVSEESDKLRAEIEEFNAALKTAEALSRVGTESTSSADDAADVDAAVAAADQPQDEGEAIEKALDEDFSKEKSSLKKWTIGRGWDVVSGALQNVKDGDAFVITGMPPGNTVVMEVTVVPTDVKTKDGWRVAGPVIYSDDKNYWGLSLVENADNGDRFVELKEMLDGKWESELNGPTRLTIISQGTLEWKYDKEYKMKMEMSAKGITGTVTEVGGDTTTIQYAFDNKVVNIGKPALRAYGFVSRFDSFVATVETTSSLVEAEQKALELPTGPAEPLPGETGKPGQWAPGLLAEYFIGKDFKNRVAVRVDPQGLDPLLRQRSVPRPEDRPTSVQGQTDRLVVASVRWPIHAQRRRQWRDRTRAGRRDDHGTR